MTITRTATADAGTPAGPEQADAPWWKTADRTVAVTIDGTVDVSSDGVGEGAPFSGILSPETAVLLCVDTAGIQQAIA